jgi:hypothetical protein
MKNFTQNSELVRGKREANPAQARQSGASVYQTKRAILEKLRGKLVVFDRPFDQDRTWTVFTSNFGRPGWGKSAALIRVL